MLPSFTDLVYFHEVATLLNFSNAAKKLHVSQPSLSLAIKRLEISLNTCLFIRHKQGITLTRSGNELYRNVKIMLTQWDETLSNIKNADQSVKGAVHIGCHSTMSPFLTNMVSKLLKQYPGLEIHFHHELTKKIMEDIVRGQLDIGITVDPFPQPNVILHQIGVSEFTYWASVKHLQKVDLYAEDTVIICDPQLPPTQFLIKQLQKERNHKRLRLSTINQLETIAAMTAENCGVGILPQTFTERFFGDQLKKIPGAPMYNKPMCLAYRPENKNVMAIQVVLGAMNDYVREQASVKKSASSRPRIKTFRGKLQPGSKLKEKE
jgi:DNA-binding transcriptional LysR family regulator